MTETILKANYTTVRKQETSVSKHEDISIQSIKEVLHTDDPCLNIICLSLILSATRKRNIFCLPFEIKKNNNTNEKCLQTYSKEECRKMLC